MSVWINEFHYDNAGGDVGEFIEVAGAAGTNLAGYSLVLYNGNPSSGASYNTLNLTGTLTDQSNGLGVLSFSYPVNGIQNGGASGQTEPDGIALIGPGGTVVEFISYEGSFVATGGPANGVTSTNVGVNIYEPGTASGTSIARVGAGAQASDFTWAVSSDTHGAVNSGQTFGSSGPAAQTLSISAASADHAEGTGTDGLFTFTVTRSAATGAASVDWNVSGIGSSGQASTDDFANTGGSVQFADGQTSQTVTVQVHGDGDLETDESFSVTLSNGSAGTVLGTATAAGVIRNDDAGPPAVNAKVWINEFHYDNLGTDSGEFIEVAAPAGTNLSGYSLVLYNGGDGKSYGTIALSGIVSDQQGGFGTIKVDAAGLQNGSPDGIALVGPAGVVEFVSYEGAFTAANGPASGQTSTDIGVFEDASVNGGSVGRTGVGVEGGELTWKLFTQATAGAVNADESFPANTPRVHVSDVTIAEGDAGTSVATFTVTRYGASDAFQVHYATADGTATAASGDYVSASSTLTFAAGETSKTVQVVVNGDTAFEPNETFYLNLSEATGPAVIADGQGVATIGNDDLAPLRIFEIQGAGHTSEYVGQRVATDGVITAIDDTGFWLQDEQGDGNAATSDAVFVFTGSRTSLAAGDLVHVVGTVDEYQGANTNNLTITEVGQASVTLTEHGHTIAATEIGGAGLPVPSSVIEDDNYAAFDPQNDALDFFESIEGMLVTVKDAVALDSTYQGATWLRAGGADNVNSRGGLTITADDPAPEKIQVYADLGVNPTFNATYVMGDHLGDVTGVISYYGGSASSGGQYELLPTSVGSTASTGVAPRETTALTGSADHVTIATYNLENLDPTDPDSKFQQLASDIANNLHGPDLIGVEEVQDADGAGNGANYSGAVTLQKLVDAIAAAGGPHYQWVEIAPTANNANGGEPGGNIRQAFLYNPDRVGYVDGSARQLFDTDPANGDAYNNSRHPLVADFTFHGETITAIDIHNYSRGGSEETFGLHQPATNSGDVRRIDQTQPVADYVKGLLTGNPDAHVAVMGDFNGFYFEEAQTQLETEGGLYNLTRSLDAAERYSYTFEGASQEIDYIYVSPSLTDGSKFDLVHLNTGQSARPTDHDPAITSLYVNTAPVAAGEAYAVAENQVLVVDAAHGVLANDTDVNGDQLTATLQQGPADGHLTLNADGSFTYAADADVFDLLTAGQSVTETFTYVVKDPSGESRTASASFTVSGVADGAAINGGNGGSVMTGTAADEAINGGNGADTVSGGLGADTLAGANGSDDLYGGAGIDSLSGGNGADLLDGGAGDDQLRGGLGADRFVFTGAFGADVVADFEHNDHIQLDQAQFADFAAVLAHAEDSAQGVVVSLDASHSITLLGMAKSSLSAGDFIFV